MDDHFDRLIFRAGFTPKTLAKWLDLSERTIQRWRRYGAPLIALRCLELRAGYDNDWKGFRIVKNELHTATGHTFNSFQIEQYSWFMQSQYRMGYNDGFELREKNSQRLLRFPIFEGMRPQDETQQQKSS